MTKIAIILGSTRVGRNGEAVAKWVLEHAQQRTDAEFELVDLRDYPLPLFDEPTSPAYGASDKEEVQRWTAKVAEFDGYVFVTPEYNHSLPAVLKNAIDYVYAEWNNKAASIVSYGTAGGARAAEHLRLVAAEAQMATVRQQVTLSIMIDFVNMSQFSPAEYHLPTLDVQLDQLVAWSRAFAAMRAGSLEGAAA